MRPYLSWKLSIKVKMLNMMEMALKGNKKIFDEKWITFERRKILKILKIIVKQTKAQEKF